MRKKTALLWMATLLFSFNVFSQETTSELQGVITGENGQALQGASIVAVHTPTGTRYTTSSRADGRYNLPNVRVGGPYELTVSFIGFQPDKQADINLILGTAYKADFALLSTSGNLTEVTVVATRSDRVFSRSRTGAAEIISRTQIDRLPTINRSLQDFTRLTPSANGNSFAGRSSSYNNLTVNGAAFNNTFGLSGTLGGQTNSQPISIDALDQIQVNVAPYDVTLGSFTGAGINSVTRSGTNNFRGSVYYYWKNPYLTGDRVGTTTLTPEQEFNFSNRGANVGGYFIKNKLFFFVSGEQERLSQPATSFTASRTNKPPVPGAVSQANGDTLEVLRQFLKSKYSYDPGEFENYNYDTKSDKITARIDLNINSKNTFNVNYYYLKSSRNVVPSASGANGSRVGSNFAMPFFSSSYVINNNFNIFIAELNTRFSNKLSNKLQVGYNRLRDFRSSPGSIFPMVDIENGAGTTFTSFGYEPFTAFNTLSTDTWQFNDVVTLNQGKHTLTFGTQNTYNKFRNGFAPAYYGIYRFRNLTDFYLSANNGTPTATRYELRYSARKGGEFPYADITGLQLGFFAQDRWNATNNLVITAGLRADLPIFSDDNFIANPVADTLTYRNGVRINSGQGPKTSVLWSPRIGFNWDAKGDKTLQVRGGIGIFAGAPPFVYISNQASNNGVDFGSYVIQPGQNGILQTDPRLAFSSNVDKNRPANAAANTSYNLAVTDRDFKFPQVFRTNLAVDKKIFADITATLEGIYTKDINAVTHQNIGLPSSGTALVGSDNRIRYSATQIYSVPTAQQTLGRPNITDAILMTNTSEGCSYNITGQLQRNVNNLYTMVAYTFGESKSVNDGGSIAQSIWRDRPVSGDPNALELGYSSFNQPHRVVAAAFYRKEYKKYFATSVGFTFEAANGGTASYVYTGDVNGDGQTANDLIYVPRDASDIVLETAAASSGVPNDARTLSIIWNQLDAFIRQDPYLSKRRGMYAERNGLQLPFYKRLDLNFTQDFIIRLGDRTNTFRFTADIFNFGNLINKNWGTFRTTSRSLGQGNTYGLLNFKRVETTGANAGKPVYSFNYLDAVNQIPMTSSFQNSTGQSSRFQIQLGIRYLFQ